MRYPASEKFEIIPLIEKGLLKTIKPRAGERGRRVSIASLLAFESEYVSSASLAAKFKARSNFMIDSLDLLGVQPVPELPAIRRVYRWRDIPKDFRILSRSEIAEKRKALGLSTKAHPWCWYPTRRA